MVKEQFDCSKCPGFCCSYDVIELTEPDIDRIASHLRIAGNDVIDRHTKYGAFHGESRRPYLMKHKHDLHFATICTFFDQDNWRCGIYPARPEACRAYPGSPTCGYFEFLKFERKRLRNDRFVAVTR